VAGWAGFVQRLESNFGRSSMTTTTARNDASVQSAGTVEIRSIDYVPESERHGKPWHLGPSGPSGWPPG
jgi:hypothetical protein